MANMTKLRANLPSVRARIYHSLYDSKGFLTRQMLAEHVGVSMPTLYQNLNELMEEGLVFESGEEQSTGGRKPRSLDIVPDARFSIGIAVNENSLRIVAADLRLKELAYQRIPFDVRSCLDGNAPKIAAHLEEFLHKFPLDRSRLLGVGVTVPGLVSEDHQTLFVAPTLDLSDIPLQELLGDIPCPVYVDNDGSVSGHAEFFMRRNTQNMAYLLLEEGVGGAVLIGGSPYAGNHNRSGEFGHICVEPGGLKCSCGKLGCLEPYCSPLRIESSLGISTDDFFQGVADHDPACEALFYDMLRHLAVGVNAIRMSLDCDVVLGGFLSEYLVPYLPVIRQYVLAGNPFEENADFVQFSSLRRHITPLGAALHFVREFVENI
ncbi:MAG: ROK family transcriptional regulator [Lachnospiraceae bacterium]|nr:ROK family transcriptional regulator [Lachnospiraceae bacterium]MBR0153371.1 ROK family transcriptional regulator [Lachnospiraceae bacterium]